MDEYLGRSGDVGGYRLVVEEDRVVATKEGVTVVDHEVPRRGGLSIGRFVADATELNLDWTRLPDGDEAIVIADAGGGATGLAYVLNLTDEALSGWMPVRR